MAVRRTPTRRTTPATPQAAPKYYSWGGLDWSHTFCARYGSAGVCSHCGTPTLLKHPVTGMPCHKVCAT